MDQRTWALRTVFSAVPLLALTLVVGCGGGDDGDDRALIEEGAVAPDFSLPAANGKAATLNDYAGERNVLLYFSMGSG